MPKNGLILIKPTTVNKTGTGSSATINTNGSVTFSACETLSLNGVFTADYDNYMIVCRFSASTTTEIKKYLRASGTDTTTNHIFQSIESDGIARSASRNSTGWYWGVAYSYNVQRCGFVAELYGPFLSQPTSFRSMTVGDKTGAYLYDAAGTHSTSSQYDGFTLSGDGGATMTGLVSVYGLRN